VIAMVIAGTCLFALAYRGERRDVRTRRAYVTIAVLMTGVVAVLAVNTLFAIAVGVYEQRIRVAADAWLGDTPGAEVVDVSFQSSTAVVQVLVPGAAPSTSTLLASLKGKVPSGVDLVVEVDRGQRIDAGSVD